MLCAAVVFVGTSEDGSGMLELVGKKVVGNGHKEEIGQVSAGLEAVEHSHDASAKAGEKPFADKYHAKDSRVFVAGLKGEPGVGSKSSAPQHAQHNTELKAVTAGLSVVEHEHDKKGDDKVKDKYHSSDVKLIDQGLKGEPGVGDGKAIQKDEDHGTELKFVTKGLDAVEQAHNKDVQVPKSLH